MPYIADLYYHLYNKTAPSSSPPIVLIHGAGGNHLSWLPVFRRMPGYQVFALDLPGHGKSGGRGMQSIEDYAQAILVWMDSLKLNRAVFIGHSMGTAIALTIALIAPKRAAGLVLIDGGAQLPVSPELLENISNEATVQRAIEQIINWSFTSEAPETLKNFTKQSLSQTRPSVLYGDLLACDAFDVTDRLSNITQPTLIICGVKDKMTPVRFSKFLEQKIPNAILNLVPDAGHMVISENPDPVIKAILAFLSTTR